MRLFIAFLLTLLPLGASAQMVAPTHVHPLTNIEGSKHPELIPDSVALQLFATVAGAEDQDTGDDLNNRTAQVERIGLNPTDSTTVSLALSRFKKTFKGTTDSFNKEATATVKAGGNFQARYSAFLQDRETSCKNLQTEIESTLSPQGAARFRSFIQNEKKFITVSAQ